MHSYYVKNRQWQSTFGNILLGKENLFEVAGIVVESKKFRVKIGQIGEILEEIIKTGLLSNYFKNSSLAKPLVCMNFLNLKIMKI